VQRSRSQAGRTEPDAFVNASEEERDTQHDDYADAGWNRRSFEILHLARVTVGECIRSHIESRKTADAAHDEIREYQHVPSPAQAEREAEDGRSDTERDDVRQRVEVGADARLTRPVQTSDVPVEHVERQRRREQYEGRPEEPAVSGRQEVQAQEDSNGAARGVPNGQRIRGREGPYHREMARPAHLGFSLAHWRPLVLPSDLSPDVK